MIINKDLTEKGLKTKEKIYILEKINKDFRKV